MIILIKHKMLNNYKLSHYLARVYNRFLKTKFPFVEYKTHLGYLAVKKKYFKCWY